MNPFKTVIYDKKNKKEIETKDITMETDKNKLQVLLAHFDNISNRRYVIGDVYYDEFKDEFYIFSLLRVDAINYKTNSIEDSVIKSFGFSVYKDGKIKFVNKKEFFNNQYKLLNDNEYIGNIIKNDLNYKNESQISRFSLASLYVSNLNNVLTYKVNGQQYNINLKTLKTFTGDIMVFKKIINEPFTFDIGIKFKSAKGEILTTSEHNGSLFKLRNPDDLTSIDFIDDDIRSVNLSNKEMIKLRSFYKEVFAFLNNDGYISYISTSSINSNEKVKGYPITSYSSFMRSNYEIVDYVRNMDESYHDAILRAL